MCPPGDNKNTQVLEQYFDLLLTPEEEHPVEQPQQDIVEASSKYIADDVIQPVNISPEPEPEPEPEPIPYVAPLGSLQMVIPSALPEAEEQRLRALAVSMHAQLHVDSELVQLPDEAVQENTSKADSWSDNGRPQWANEAFDCLLFDVQGLRLGLPLVSLGSIYPLDREAMSAMPGQSRCFLGTSAMLGQQFSVVDTAQMVMPERADPAKSKAYRYLVTLEHSRWALAVTAIDVAKRFEPDEVHWRSLRTQRPWLAGTIRSQMVALMDPQALCELLVQKS
jgi:purine-binding chemotaxis protein CheW